MIKKKPKQPVERAYALRMNARQAGVVQEALEIIARLGIGQFRYALDYLPFPKDRDYAGWHEDLDTIGRMLAKYTTGHVDGWTCNLGIYNKETPELSRIAWDLQQVVRHRLSWDRAVDAGHVENLSSPRNWKEMMGVNFDSPMKSSPEPLATIESSPSAQPSPCMYRQSDGMKFPRNADGTYSLPPVEREDELRPRFTYERLMATGDFAPDPPPKRKKGRKRR